VAQPAALGYQCGAGGGASVAKTEGTMGDLLHFEDFPDGEVLTYGAYEVTTDEIKEFAAEYDPQPFHLDEEAGRASILGGLCASGWQVCAIMNRLNVDAYLARSASMGSFGLEEVKWLKPVFPGETLTIRRTTLDRRVSARRPDMGIVKFHWQVFNAAGEMKLDSRGFNLFKVWAAG
jgi:acyl dehydratase